MPNTSPSGCGNQPDRQGIKVDPHIAEANLDDYVTFALIEKNMRIPPTKPEEPRSGQPTNKVEPLVKERTRTEGASVSQLLSMLTKDQSGFSQAFIPNYQRDSNQWDDVRKTRFIESVINNLTTPAIFLCENDEGRFEVVDGQQRLNTLLDYKNDQFKLSEDKDIDYISPQYTHYRGKYYFELEAVLKHLFNFYSIAVIYLPPKMELSIKLEVFRRINEGGTPLTGQDIRLSFYSDSRSVAAIRLAGIHHDVHLGAGSSDEAEGEVEEGNGEDYEPPNSKLTNAVEQMIAHAETMGVTLPWERHTEPYVSWENWWKGKTIARGQTPSLAYLWYLVSRCHTKLNDLLSDNIPYLRLHFKDSIESALDVFCAQLRYQDNNPPGLLGHKLPSFEEISGCFFDDFAEWIGYMLERGTSGLGPDKFKQIALFIGAAAAQGLRPEELNDNQWDLLSRFLAHTRGNVKLILGETFRFPEPKGRWGLHTQAGQLAQCEAMHEVVKRLRDFRD